jgi:hypothetical protein
VHLVVWVVAIFGTSAVWSFVLFVLTGWRAFSVGFGASVGVMLAFLAVHWTRRAKSKWYHYTPYVVMALLLLAATFLEISDRLKEAFSFAGCIFLLMWVFLWVHQRKQ